MDKFDRNYIGGEWVNPSTTRTLEVHNPSTRELIATVPDSDGGDVEAGLFRARRERRAAVEDAGMNRVDGRVVEVCDLAMAEVE